MRPSDSQRPGLSRRRLIAAAGAAGLGALLVSRSSAAFADTPPAYTDPWSRFIYVEGAYNTRDFGGYYTESGRQVAVHQLWRTSSLQHVDANGLAILELVNMRRVADFRSQQELAQGLDVLPAGVTNLFVPIGDPAPPSELPGGSAGTPAGDRLAAIFGGTSGVTSTGAPPPGGLTSPDPDTIAEFQSYITSTEARQSLGAAINAIADADHPFMWHCNSGTYRTGWASAVLQQILGVSKEDIYADFLLSNLAFGAVYTFNEYLDAAYAEIERVYGTFERYVVVGLGVSATAQLKLRWRLLV